MLTESEGEAFLDEVKRFIPFDPTLVSKKQAKSGKRFPKLKPKLEEWAEANRVEAEEFPVPPRPSNTQGLLYVPAYSPVTLELMQTVSSSQSSLGETVWLRVADQADVNGKPWLAGGTRVQGTIREVHRAKGGGASGGLEIGIPSLKTPNGTPVSLVGQWLSGGRPRSQAAAVAFGFGGLLGSALTKGRAAFEPVGMEIPVWTRGEVWIEPVVEEPTLQPIEAAREGSAAFAARALEPLTYDPEARKPPAPITILVETDQEVDSLSLFRVDDWHVPDPPEAVRVMSEEGGSVATFDGWDLLRHLCPGSDAKVRFEGRLGDGTPFSAEAGLEWKPSQRKE